MRRCSIVLSSVLSAPEASAATGSRAARPAGSVSPSIPARCSGVIVPPPARRTARSQTFLSSRTLPGQS